MMTAQEWVEKVWALLKRIMTIVSVGAALLLASDISASLRTLAEQAKIQADRPPSPECEWIAKVLERK